MSSGASLLGRVRTPAKPGPGEITVASLRALDLAIGKRIDGLLPGDFGSALNGKGSEIHQIRPYVPGDDVRRIDWNVTARTNQAHVRIDRADRALVTWLVIDSSASMAFGTQERRKADVAEGVAVALGHLATRRGNKLGMISFGGRPIHVLQPSQSRQGLLRALDVVRREPAGAGDLEQALDVAGSIATRRSLMVIVSDFRDTSRWPLALLRLAQRHRAIGLEIRDPREQQLTDVGQVRMLDPETGEHLFVDTSDEGLRDTFALRAEAEREEVKRSFSSSGVGHSVLTTEEDWLNSLALFLRRDRQR